MGAGPQADADRLTLDQPSLDSQSFSVVPTEEAYLQVRGDPRRTPSAVLPEPQ